MFETETVGPYLLRKLKWGEPWTPGPFSGDAPVYIYRERGIYIYTYKYIYIYM